MRHLKWLGILALCLGALAFVGCAGDTATEQPAEEAPPPPPPPPPPEPVTATAMLQGRSDSGVTGKVTFTEAEGGVQIVAEVSGAGGAGSHGFHIHETGDCSSEDFKSAGGHFNPTGVDHAGPDDESHHGR